MQQALWAPPSGSWQSTLNAEGEYQVTPAVDQGALQGLQCSLNQVTATKWDTAVLVYSYEQCPSVHPPVCVTMRAVKNGLLGVGKLSLRDIEKL